MIYLFDKDEKLIKIVRKSAVKTALQKYALTTERYVSDRLTVELKGLNADELERVEYMAIQTMEDAHIFHYFYVAQKSSDELTTLIGVQSGIEELRKSPVFDKRPQNAFARDVITDLLAGTNWQARFVGETTPHSTNFYYTSVFDALKKVCEVWDLEMQFFVEMNGNRIGGRYIDFKQRIGEAVGKRVVYGHNALQILQEVERTNIFTALIGRGKGEETGAGYGRKITFEDVTWSTDQGKPVNKPKGQKYLELPLMTQQYGIKNADGSMRPKIGFVDFSEEENPEILIERTYRALVDAARPQLTLKTSSVYLKGVEVGDTIRVVRHDKKLDYDTRIFEITFNRLNNQSSDIKLGDRIGESNEAKVQTIADKAVEQFVNNEFSNFVQNLPDYLPSADGFNNNWYGAEDPTVQYPGKVLINDIWFKPDSEHEGHKIMLRWTGEVWEEILRTYESESLRERIAEEIAQVNQSMEAAIREVDQTANSLVSKITNVENIQLEGIQRISTLETEAGQLPSKIASIVSGYDFVNQNYVDTKLNEETGEIVRKLAYVENLAKASDRNFFFVRDLDNRITGTTFKIVTLKLSPETTYTVSTEFPKSASGTYKVFASRTPISVSHASNGVGQGYPRTITTGPDGKLDIAFTGSDLENIKAMAVGSRIMVNFGDVTKDWQMAPEDTSSEESFRLLQAEYAESVEGLKVKLSEVESMNNTLSEKVTTLNVSAGVIRQTISGIKTNPRGTISGYNELINKVDGVVQTIGDSESVARLVMGSNVYQQEISNLNKISTRNLVRDSGNLRAWLPYARNIITASQTTLKGEPAWTIRGAGMSSLHPNPLLIQRGFALTTQEGTEWLTSHFLVRNDLTNGLPLEFKMNNIDAPGVRVESGETVRVVFSGKHPVGGTLALMVISPNNLYANADFTIGPIMVTRSRQVVDHMYAPEDAESEIKVIRNQVTQTSTSWAVRNLTEQGDIISQMNLIDDLVKIQARFIHLSGESLIEKGVIKSAHIGDAQIGTAHIGTIDAAVARIINIDAGNITSGYISSDRILAGSIGVDKITGLTSEFIRSLWQGDGRVVRIDNRGFLIFEIDGKNFVDIGSNGLQFSSDTGNNAVVKNIKSTEYGLNDKNVVLLASRRGNHIGLGYESAAGSNVFIRSLSVDPYSGFLKLHKELATNGQWIAAGGTAQGERIRFIDEGGVLAIYRYGGGGLRLQNGDFSYYNALKGWISFNQLEARVAQLERH